MTSSEYKAVSETAIKLFADLFPDSRTFKRKGFPFLEAEWRQLEALGLTNALIPETMGGFGLEPVEALDLVRIAGAHAVPLPFAETLMASWSIAHAGAEVPPGPLTVAAASPQDIQMNRSGAAWNIRGSLARVPWATHARALGLVVEDGGQNFLVMLEGGQWRSEPGANLAGEPRDDVVIETALPPGSVRELPTQFQPQTVRLLGAAMRSCAIAGALEKALALCVQYAGERVQFGRPIGKFQAIQQNLAILAAEAAAAGAAASLAAEAVANGVEPLAIAISKTRAGEAAGKGAAIAHQIFGAIGFTQEHRLHRYTQRLWSWREEFGNETEWSAFLGRHALAAGWQGLWPLVTSI